MKSWLWLALVLGVSGHADDLETLFGGQKQSTESRANTFLSDSVRSLLPTTTPEQNSLLRSLEGGEWSAALVQWDEAFGGKPFELTQSGRALRSLIQFKADLPVTGLENLFAIDEPKKVHFQILNTWREAAHSAHPAWSVARVTWSDQWTEVLGSALAIKVQAADLSGARSIEELTAMSMRAPSESRERAMLEWQLALAYALKDQADKSAKIMASLFKSKNNPIALDLMHITVARMLFQNGYFEPAFRYYDKIPKGADLYLEAQEEKAWAYMRRGEPQNTLAVTQTLVSPVLRGQISAETWFLRSLAQLKVCDYLGAVQSLNSFPKEFKDRTVALEALGSGKAKPARVQKVLERMKDKPMSFGDMAQMAGPMPRALPRDEKTKYLLHVQRVLEAEAASAEKLYGLSLKVAGGQEPFEELKNKISQRLELTKNESLARVRALAAREVEDTRKIVSKMHIVEAELIQRIDAAPKVSKQLAAADVKKGSTGSVAKDTLTFPLEKEFWFDELTNYRVDIKKGCQSKVVR